MNTIIYSISQEDLDRFTLRAGRRRLIPLVAGIMIFSAIYQFLLNPRLDTQNIWFVFIVPLISLGLVTLSLYFPKKTAFGLVMVYAGIILLLVVFGTGSLWTRIQSSLALFWFILWAFGGMALLRISKNSVMEHQIGKHELTLTDKGVHERWSAGEVSYEWEKITSFEEDSHEVYLDLGGRASFIIPKKSFSSAETLSDFLSKARSLKAASRDLESATIHNSA